MISKNTISTSIEQKFQYKIEPFTCKKPIFNPMPLFPYMVTTAISIIIRLILKVGVAIFINNLKVSNKVKIQSPLEIIAVSSEFKNLI